MKNKVLGVLLSLIIAFGLWLYVVTVVSPGSDATYYNIPVTLQNENILKERGLMITSEYPSVNLRLEGNRTDLSKLNSGNITVLANVAGILAPGTHFLDYSESYPGDIAGNSVAVLNKDPELIVLKVEKRITKPVPVVIQYEGVLHKHRSGFSTGSSFYFFFFNKFMLSYGNFCYFGFFVTVIIFTML